MKTQMFMLYSPIVAMGCVMSNWVSPFYVTSLVDNENESQTKESFIPILVDEV